MASRRRQSAKLVALLSLLALFVMFLLVQYSKPLGISGLAILALLIIVRAISHYADREISHLLKRERQAIRGAEGEEEVEGVLSSLNERYLVVNDVETPFGNIDHIVLTRSGGVFIIETKAHRGKVEMLGDVLTVNGQPPDKNFIKQVLSNAFWLRDEVAPILGNKPWITPLLVFTNAFVPRIPPIKGVMVLNKRFLVETLASPASRNDKVWPARETIARRLNHQIELPSTCDHAPSKAA